jgi:hypothetical protein
MIKKVVAGIATAGIAFTAIPPVVQEQHHDEHEVIDLHAGHDHSEEELEYMAANGMSDPEVPGYELMRQVNFQPCSTITWGFDRSNEQPGSGGQPKDGVLYAIRDTLNYLSQESGLTFVESPTLPFREQTLRFRYDELPGTIWGLGGGTPGGGGRVYLDHSVGRSRIDPSTYSGSTQALILHEVMHAMGFAHQNSQSSIMYRYIGARKDLGDVDKGLLGKYYPRTNCPAPAPEPQPEPEVAPTPPPPPPTPEDRTGWLMRDTVSPNLLTKGKAKSFKFEDGYYKDNMTGSNWTVKKGNKVTLDCTIPEGTPKGNRKGCYADHTLHVFELKGPKKGKKIDMGKTVKVPNSKGKYIVVVAPEEPTKYNKNKGRIVWMVKK